MSGSLLAIAILIVIPLLGGGGAGWRTVFGVVAPYTGFALFLLGVVYRGVVWSRSPVPFHIPTTCGQEKSLPWIRNSFLESPPNNAGVIGRMALEVLLFRSLFRNNRVQMVNGRAVYAGAKWLWLAGLVFHWSFLIILIRHMRFFLEPVPGVINLISNVDGFFLIGVPTLFLSDMLLLVSVTYLFLRRVLVPQVRYISLPADYFPLLLILAIGSSGVLMRHLYKVDLSLVKQLILGLVLFHPVHVAIGSIFYVHLFLVSVLLAYLPMSKLVHMGGIFLSPTRNLANDSRRRRHVNPWNYPVPVHTYETYEDEFREKMKAAGIPVERG